MSDQSIRDLVERTAAAYSAKFGRRPQAAAVAPGRVEVLGNHTDYNGGYVLSAAIDRRTCLAARASDDGALRVAALDMDDAAEVQASAIKPDDEHKWANYLFGVADQIQKLPSGPELKGASIEVHSEVPLGAGLSSSAALEVATALALQALYPYEIDKMGLAQLCQRAENQFVGVSSGLMDQFSSVFGRQDSVLFLDCQTLEHDAIAMGGHPVSLVVCDSMVKHALTGGEYNSRREECMSAARKMGHTLLRDATLDELETARAALSENEYKRAKHVIGENNRVLQAKAAARAGEMTALGRLMAQSHESSRTLFQNSTQELDRLVEIALGLPGCYGARLTGGGFGGAVLSLVETARAEEFSREIAERYGKTIDKTPAVFICRMSAGASVEPVE